MTVWGLSLLLLLGVLGGCALAPVSVTTPGKTVGIFFPQVVVNSYNPVIYPARPLPPEDEGAGGGRQ